MSEEGGTVVGLGGSRGILACGSQLLLETGDRSLHLLQQDTLRVQLRLQLLASGTKDRTCFGHDISLSEVNHIG